MYREDYDHLGGGVSLCAHGRPRALRAQGRVRSHCVCKLACLERANFAAWYSFKALVGAPQSAIVAACLGHALCDCVIIVQGIGQAQLVFSSREQEKGADCLIKPSAS